MEAKRPRNHQVMRCRRHPKHQQSPGVCSICLGERLSQLSTSLRSTTSTMLMASTACSSSTTSFSSLSSTYSSNASSACSSPMHRNYRLGLEGKRYTMSLLRSGKNVLMKSKSLAFVSRRRDQAGVDDDGKKKGGFWSKLVRSRSKMDHGLVLHSRTTRPRHDGGARLLAYWDWCNLTSGWDGNMGWDGSKQGNFLRTLYYIVFRGKRSNSNIN
ncbi:hypothetical protein RJ640_006568 [Escallonia rubra]|uniref:Uncharacterized protein n=1 Tax=Escallonia rubra TaxID=112253 RepID=A0AA88S3B3_9ASTE|nr:hypothetical protein RJ640_006568 [Escallonia rubra]